MPIKIKVEEGPLYRWYSFRGPKSHRPVKVTVVQEWYQRWRESVALTHANARVKVLSGSFSDQDWEIATTDPFSYIKEVNAMLGRKQ